MTSALIFLAVWTVLGLGLAAFFAFAIIKSVGFKNLFAIFKVKTKLKKGWGLVLMYQKTGFPKNIPMKFEGEMLEPFGKEEGRYIFKANCMFTNEYGIPTIAYREDDANPINPRLGVQNSTSPQVLENILSKALKAEKEYNGDFLSFLKQHWLKILMFYLGPLAILGFIVLNQQDSIATLASQAGQQVVINGSSVGR